MIDLQVLFQGVLLLFGVVGALGTGYLLYDDSIVVHYPSFFRIITAGLFVFAVTAPIIVFVAPGYIHAIHSVAALFVSVGLYTLVRDQLGTGFDEGLFDAEQFDAESLGDEE